MLYGGAITMLCSDKQPRYKQPLEGVYLMELRRCQLPSSCQTHVTGLSLLIHFIISLFLLLSHIG